LATLKYGIWLLGLAYSELPIEVLLRYRWLLSALDIVQLFTASFFFVSFFETDITRLTPKQTPLSGVLHRNFALVSTVSREN